MLWYCFFLLSLLVDFSNDCLAKCRLPDLEKSLIGYYLDDNTNEGHGKELQPGAYIRHGFSVKYQCQCQSKSKEDCSLIKSGFIQCIDGQWTNNAPLCREGIYFILEFYFLVIYLLNKRNVQEMSSSI